MELKPIDLPFGRLRGISEKQIAEHYEVLYKGYVVKVNLIRDKIGGTITEGANGTFADIRELKLEESFAINGVKLHEAYFLGLGGDGVVPEKVKEIFARDFGSFEAWKEEFVATGMSARGWAVTYYDWSEERLRVGLMDWHSHGGVWNGNMILVLDVYEHAYFLDFSTKRADYIKVYFDNIDWDYVGGRINKIKRR